MDFLTAQLYIYILCARTDHFYSDWMKTERKDDHKATSISAHVLYLAAGKVIGPQL